jgi:N-acyl-D-aspartate/D-glutamate deacylase
MKKSHRERQGDIKYDITWTTLDEGLRYLVDKGISPNVASFVGATTLREHTVGHVDRPATPDELDTMRELMRQAMEDGALGVGSSLIYAPACYADTDELIALAEIAAAYGGMYNCWKPSTSYSPSRAAQAPRLKSGTSRRRGQQTGTSSTQQSSVSRRRAPKGCASPPTCTRIAPRPPGSTRRCLAGFRRVATAPGSSA